LKLEINDLTVQYSEDHHTILALENVSLAVEPGTCVALLGESGSGKTTLARAALGILPNTASVTGSLRLDERELLGLPEDSMRGLRHRTLALAFQEASSLNPLHKVIDQVAEPLLAHGLASSRDARDRAREHLLAWGLDGEMTGRLPSELSGGQAQRAVLALATVCDPPVLILDEPSSSMDALSVRWLEEKIEQYRAKGTAILLVSHDLGVASRLADRVYSLYLGQVMEELPGRKLMQDPYHPYTLGLVRSWPGLSRTRDLGGIRGDAVYRNVHRHRTTRGDHKHVHVQEAGSIHTDGHPLTTGCIFRDRCTQAVDECSLGEVGFYEREGHRLRCIRKGIVDIVTLEGLRKCYGESPALDGISLNVRSGEVMALVGRSGSGKTTLARCLMGTLRPDEGSITYREKGLDRWLSKGRIDLAGEMAMVHQDPTRALNRRLTVFEAVAEPLQIQKWTNMQSIREEVGRVLAAVRLPGDGLFLDLHVGSLNAGALQRLAIARALVLRPRLLIADEPTSSLDPSVQAKILKMLMELQVEEGLTLLFITHDLGLARRVADRVAVLEKGSLVELAPAERLFSCPEHPVTRSLLGEPVHEKNCLP
jgi:peptide/nickel transport system ATP-binding protein